MSTKNEENTLDGTQLEAGALPSTPGGENVGVGQPDGHPEKNVSTGEKNPLDASPGNDGQGSNPDMGADLVNQKAEDAIPAINETTDLATLDGALAAENAGKKRKTVLEAIKARKLDLTMPNTSRATPSTVDPLDDATIDGSTVVNPPSRTTETDETLADLNHEIHTGQKRPVVQGNIQLPETVKFAGQKWQVYTGPCPDCERQDQAWDYAQIPDPNNPNRTIDVRIAVCEHRKVS